MTRSPGHIDDPTTVLRSRVEEPEGDAFPCFLLRVMSGPDQGRSARFDGAQSSRILIGQSPACDLRLTDRQVSRRHVALELAGPQLRLTDLGSTNGTFIGNLSVLGAFLRGGETIRIGDTALRIDRAPAGDAPALAPAMRFGRVIGASPEMRKLYPRCERLAQAEVPMVIEGETGTGKELLAESLHDASPRAAAPFVVFDCTAVPTNLVESALFGHERGAFTGAVASRRGVFEQAHGGTLFIDEIGDLDIALQPKLLRAIERSEIQRVGAEKWQKVNVRVIAATRRDLDHEIQAGRFRDDLFFRLAVARIELPPLRRRQGDVGVLARHFWRELGGEDEPLPTELLHRFADHSWPGNVRELHNTIARHLALGEFAEEEDVLSSAGPPITTFPDATATGDAIEAVLTLDLPLPRARERVVKEFERRYIERVVARYGGNVGRAAAASGIARRYFQIIRARQKT